MTTITDEQVRAAMNAFDNTSEQGKNDRDAFRAALEAAERAAWQKIESAPSGVKLIAQYQNELNNSRQVMAVRYEQFQREHDSDNEDLEGEYCAAKDAFYWPAGWYEMIENWDNYTHVAMDAPIKWRPLPAPPAKGDE